MARQLARVEEDGEDLGFCLFGADSLLTLLKAMEGQIEGVREREDIEYIHKMRVASRRIRAALPLFKDCFPKKDYKRWLSEIRNVTRFLGQARDADVQIIFVENYLKGLGVERPSAGFIRLSAMLKGRRKDIQEDVIGGLEDLDNSRALKEMAESCGRIVGSAKDEVASPTKSTRAATDRHISEKLEAFLVMEDCVHKEDEIQRHHEMRISAKWLRYTMEIFSPQYEDGLKERIALVKQFQDILGEIHDCDVWIDYLPKFVDETGQGLLSEDEGKGEIGVAAGDLQLFLEDIKSKRRARYMDFVSLWDMTKEKGTFEELRKLTSSGGSLGKMLSLIDNENPRLALISDIHGNLQALEAVLEDANARGIKAFVNAGDFVGYGASPDEVVKALRKLDVPSVIGNFDLEVLEGGGNSNKEKDVAFKFDREKLSKSSRRYLASVPHRISFEIEGKAVLLTHGSPESLDEHLDERTPEERLTHLAKVAGTDIIVIGHSHRQFSRTVNGTTFINPGGVGRSDDGDPRAAYAIVTFNPLEVEMIRIDYDYGAAVNSIRKIGLPEHFAQMVLCGMPLDAVVEEEEALEQKEIWRNPSSIDQVKKVSDKYCENDHCKQVRGLALELFDQLGELHNMGARERYWLECATLLHDIGLSRSIKGHHKQSLRMILNERDLPFTSYERYLVGSIARYHRKALPDKRHYNFAALCDDDREKVRCLSSLLRVADALDYSHISMVSDVKAKTTRMKVILECTVNNYPLMEQQSLAKKKDLFEKVFGRDLMVLWKMV